MTGWRWPTDAIAHIAVVLTAVSCLVAPSRAVAQSRVAGLVFDDRNSNGHRDPGEVGIGGVVVSNQRSVVVTAPDGSWKLDGVGGGIVFVSVADGYRAVGSFWRAVDDAPANVDFPLTRSPHGASFTFLHASDTHLQETTLPRMARLRAIADSVHPDLILITGDLVRDALRVGEQEARGYFELFSKTASALPGTVWTVPGNHDVFGIERHMSLVSPKNPLYGRAMYHHYLGPDYYSFNYGGVHFVGLNSVDIDDLWYYGHVDSVQVAWLARDLAAIPGEMPVVTFNHIPFFTTGELLNGYTDDPPAPTLIRIGGRMQFRHTVSNALELLAILRRHPYPLALGGHMHMRERIEFGWDGQSTRFEQTAAVVGGSPRGPITVVSGVTLYRVERGHIGEGEFIRF